MDAQNLDAQNRLARQTGLFYLGLAITGLLGFFLVPSLLVEPDKPATTLANLAAHQALAGAGIALDLGIVLTQTLAAVWFFRLFRRVDAFAAGCIAAFGLVNATIVLVSAATHAAALDAATNAAFASAGEGATRGDAAAAVRLMYAVSDNLWQVAGIFFGLWLIPMGYCALRSGMPRVLGRLLIFGGYGYVVSAFIAYLLPDATVVTMAVTFPASIGEFWMVGYLVLRGAGSPPTTTPEQYRAEAANA
jgi:hypothetical protein